MANYGMLGQVNPAATTVTTCYTVPAATHATVRIIVANRGSAASFRIAVSPDGAALANSQYIAYDQAIEANDSVASAAFTLGSTDVVRVYASSANLTFSVTGIEEPD